jgi:splicing factor U2AF subunit
LRSLRSLTHPRYLLEDVETECKKYGSLAKVVAPRIGAPGQGKVFLEYASAGDAAAAFQALHGREFGPNRVEATYYPEADYAAGTYR